MYLVTDVYSLLCYGVAGTSGENPLSDESFEREDPLTDSSASSELSSLDSSRWVLAFSCLERLVPGRLVLNESNNVIHFIRELMYMNSARTCIQCHTLDWSLHMAHFPFQQQLP